MVEKTAAPSPANQQKKLERDARLEKERTAAEVVAQKEREQRTAELAKRTIERTKAYYAAENEQLQLQKDAKEAGGFYRAPEPKVIFAIRIKGINKIPPKPRKVLRLFRLLQLQNGVFIKVTKATLNMIKLIEPYIAYGYPSLDLVRKLVYKRGHARVGDMGSRQRIRILDNDLIHENLKDCDIHGVEDLVYEIYNCGPNFTKANNFLWTFKLNTPSKGFINKKRGYCEAQGGDAGNREQYINELVSRMI